MQRETKTCRSCAHAVISDNPRPDQRLSASCNHQCTTAFRIIPEELQFYRRMNLLLPRLCPNCRHYERLAQRNPLKLWHRSCACGGRKSQAPNTKSQYENTAKYQHGEAPCPNEFETTYSPERPEIVYCEQCYQSEVVRLILSYVEGQCRGGVMSSIVGG